MFRDPALLHDLRFYFLSGYDQFQDEIDDFPGLDILPEDKHLKKAAHRGLYAV
ncbi:hypothetical protein [uncultured Chryseobacterium sp.]|uniref:hypothetical protein n=1 Tax=uncultured Chryseobacterium sp. TaxID=259322 RepID=UPI0025FED487|nr:hypothetical protein [uncultured Chryseobacterium sp.]